MKTVQIRRSFWGLCVGLAMFASFTAGSITGYWARPVLAADQPSEFTIFWEAWDVVIDHFVERDQIDVRRMTYGAIQGMLDALGDDNHTIFFSPEVAKQEADALEGSFEGIGAYVNLENDQFKIIAPIHGSPAEAAGVLAGDTVLEVDGVDISGMQEWDVIQRVRGPSGSTVVLTILHADERKPTEISVVRGRIDIESVLWARIPQTDLAYLKISQFATDTGEELKSALRAIRAEGEQGKPIQGLVLDLRNNPGGLLSEAITAGSQFLPKDAVILHERDAEGRVTSFKSVGEGLARELPLVVLTNEGTASAGEILAGALQDNERGRVLGETTVGTGTVLLPFTLSDGSVIRLGVTNWLTPDMHLIKNQGIKPDIQIKQEASAPMVDAYSLQEEGSESGWSSEDYQFNAALYLLRLLTQNEA